MSVGAAISLSSNGRHVLQHAEGQAANGKWSPNTFVHNHAPLSPHQHGGGTVEKLRPLNGRTRVNREHLRTELTTIFRDTVKGTSKEVARAIGDEVSAETIEAWRQAVPKALSTHAAIGRAFPLYTIQSLDLMGVDLDQDLRAFAEFLSLQRRIRGQ